jgi:hypothetical protein
LQTQLDRESIAPAPAAFFIDAPRHPKIQLLHSYWDEKRHGRAMPSRADIDPVDIPALLPHILMYNVNGPGRYTVRLQGEAVRAFVGINTTGRPAGSTMKAHGAQVVIGILDTVVAARTAKFRSGKVDWLEEKAHREFEACLLPLSADGNAVNIILAAVVFTG